MSTSSLLPIRQMACANVLAKVAWLCGDKRRLHVLGPDAALLRAVASDWELVETDADAVVWFGPEASADLPVAVNASIIAIVSTGQEGSPSNYLLVRAGKHPRYLTISDWFTERTAFLPSALRGPTVRILRATGIETVVGSRICKLPLVETQERYFVRKGLEVQKKKHTDFLQDMAMSFFGVGHLPLFAANFASLIVVLLAYATHLFSADEWLRFGLIGTLVLSTLGCVLFERWSERAYFAKDAREVVLDEVAGMSLTLLFLPLESGGLCFALAFVLFRIFDIFKPGIHWIEDRGWRGTVVWDDLLAGLYAGVSLRVVMWLLGIDG